MRKYKNLAVRTGVAAAVVVTAPAAMAADALSFDTSNIVAMAAVLITAVAAVAGAFIMVPMAIKGWSYVKRAIGSV